MQSYEEVRAMAENFITKANVAVGKQDSLISTKAMLEQRVEQMKQQNLLKGEKLDICVNALAILSNISDEVVHNSYSFIEENLNMALERIFRNSVRRIKLKETVRGGTSSQLNIELTVENGIVRSLKADSGHGLMQMISLLCILCVICITGARKLVVIDEVVSGLSSEARRVLDDILWSFTQVGFQFVVSEHGFIPRGAMVYQLEIENGVSSVVNSYIEPTGVYLDTDVIRRSKKDDNAEDNVQI